MPPLQCATKLALAVSAAWGGLDLTGEERRGECRSELRKDLTPRLAIERHILHHPLGAELSVGWRGAVVRRWRDPRGAQFLAQEGVPSQAIEPLVALDLDEALRSAADALRLLGPQQSDEELTCGPRDRLGRTCHLPLQALGRLITATRVLLDECEYVLGRTSFEWRPSRQHLVQEHAQSPPIRCRRAALPGDNLGWRILVCAALGERA
mmetsp:Transcript_28430/g.72842  ORF Transcript_28430/g.72842 Transcript_28430/m.72842 type:complete len:209 (+) Transcript_28430:635-1261(+)